MSCADATIKLESPKSPKNVYIGDEVVLNYRLSGTPLPTFALFHYSKKIPFDEKMEYSYKGTDISVKSQEMSQTDVKYEVTIRNITEYFYGTYDAIAWNVVNETIDLGG